MTIKPNPDCYRGTLSSALTILLPSGIPPKPASLLASDAEYFSFYATFKDWGLDFNSLYDTYSKEGLTNNWASFWIGSSQDENKRAYFDHVGDKWRPRTITGYAIG